MAVLGIFFLNSKKYRAMLQDSFSEQPDLPTSLLCFILFTGYLLRRGSNTTCFCFALRSFLIRLPSTFENFFTFTFPPTISALLQTPECSEYHPSEQNPVVRALSLTRLQLSGTNSLFLSAIIIMIIIIKENCTARHLPWTWCRFASYTESCIHVQEQILRCNGGDNIASLLMLLTRPALFFFSSTWSRHCRQFGSFCYCIVSHSRQFGLLATVVSLGYSATVLLATVQLIPAFPKVPLRDPSCSCVILWVYVRFSFLQSPWKRSKHIKGSKEHNMRKRDLPRK